MPSVPSVLPRELITDHFKAEVHGSLELPVGVLGFPEKEEFPVWGWQSDDPDQPDENFIPYAMIGIGGASPYGGSIGDSGTEWEAIYTVTLAGVTRNQTEAVADKLRNFLVKRERISLHHTRTDESWRVIQYRCPRIGPVIRATSIKPDYYTQQDEFVVRISKEK